MKKINILVCLISIIVTLMALLSINYVSKDNYDTSLSNINIMNTNYMPLRDYILDDYYIFDYSQKEEKLKEIFKTDYTSSRLKYRASLISHIGEEEIVINGIDIQNDEKVFNILSDYTLENFDSNNSIIISKSISSILDIKTNDTVILKLITKTGHYNAEEYTVIEVCDKLNYNYALIDINNLNNFTGLENAATEVYIKKNIKNENLIKYDNDIKEIYGNDFSIYSKKDILGDNDNNQDNSKLNICILLIYLFSLFSVFIFINSQTIYEYKTVLKNKVLFSFIGFILSFIIYFIIIKLYYQKDFVFSYAYISMLIINIISVISANIKYSILEKLFIENDEEYKKNKNILIIFGLAFTYTIGFILLYLSFISSANDNSNIEKLENIVRIVKDKTSKNTFLFNGSIYNENITNTLFNEIYSYDKYAEIERVLSFPAGVVIRTGSIGSRVYAYEKNILESGLSLSNIIIEGEMFESPKREIIIGKDLANYLNLKIGDALSLIAKASRGWLETGYFYVSGIYDLKDKNYDIIGDITAMNSFIYLKEGDKSPYNESIIVFSKNDDIYSLLNASYTINENDLKVVSSDKAYYIENSSSIRNAAILLIIVLAFSLALLSSSVLSVLYRRLSKFNKSLLLNSLYALSFIISVILSIVIIFIFMIFSIKFILFSLCIVLLSFVLSLLIANYNYI
ncbi:hypothetical protein A966_13650 [Brachyspira hampsonii 30446]|uniref:MacB-like periplasmic core domain-containing protein n=1 Tax=Brachyspira hampsonii 30446 TaxID=1289135 RepID=A0A2U4EZA7_9SPIR|nr:hypothetical protein [Brachyspira hampsonii]EKV55899.1 hypothetical protein A966_13650 [Brachyspira hampsonii 30446]OEJ20360.1 hypothetical protein A9495_12365 [Brachyspira hampsonii]